MMKTADKKFSLKMITEISQKINLIQAVGAESLTGGRRKSSNHLKFFQTAYTSKDSPLSSEIKRRLRKESKRFKSSRSLFKKIDAQVKNLQSSLEQGGASLTKKNLIKNLEKQCGKAFAKKVVSTATKTAATIIKKERCLTYSVG